MDLEYYLIEEQNHILAINEICKKIDFYLKDNFYEIVKGKCDKEILEKVIALNNAVQLITYCMRQRRTEYYKKIDKNFTDNFTYEEMIFDLI